MPGIKKWFTNIGRVATDICFPPVCLHCGVSLASSDRLLFCSTCLDGIGFIQQPFCPRCGTAFPDAAGGNHLCGTCLKKEWYFSSARSVVLYNEIIAGIIHPFKYSGRTVALGTFTHLLRKVVPVEFFAEADLIIPVPLHVKRLRERGFNQALLLARAFFPQEAHKIAPFLLRRDKWTEPQTGLSGAERRKNLKHAFVMGKSADVAGKKIVLVDDIFTTGSTVNECARTLRRAGAQDVVVLTLARVKDGR